MTSYDVAGYIVLLALGVTVVLRGLWSIFWVNSTKKMVEEFERDFPGQCVICSYHAFGIREGFVRPVVPPSDHRCPEKWERWRGMLHTRRGQR